MVVGSHGLRPDLDDDVWISWMDDPRQCHDDGRLTWAGLQWSIMRAVMVTGEAFVVRRWRRADSAWPLPLSLLVLDGDAVETSVGDGIGAARGSGSGGIWQGIEYGRAGRPVAYHFRMESRGFGLTEHRLRMPAADVVHVFQPSEPEATRGSSWFAPLIEPMGDLGGSRPRRSRRRTSRRRSRR